MPLRDVIRIAYGLQSYQMDGWPGWLSSEFFDIQAKASGATTEEARRAMLRALLQSRFKFEAHMYTRRGNSYELTLAGKDRKIGPALKLSTADCTALRRNLPPNPQPPAPNAPLIVCGIRDLPGRVFALGVPLDSLAATLGNILGRPVIDRTELAGNFDLDLHYTPDPMPAPSALPPGSASIDPNGPPMLTALREQLGLTLVARTRPLELLAIDHADRPSPN